MDSPPTTNSTSRGVQYGDSYHGSVFAQYVGGQHFHFAPDGEACLSDPITTKNSFRSTATVFDILKGYLVEDALYNSETRATEHATICHPDTHTRVLQAIHAWINPTRPPICWLSGPAGTGKSTICHTIAAELEQAERPAATFFFSRKKGAREDITKLIPTLAYQIAQQISSTQSYMRSVLLEDRTLLSQAIEHQFQRLIADPLINCQARDRCLIIIDGLDECARRDRLLALIKILGQTFTTSNSPVQILLASRPEPDIASAFRMYAANKTSLWLSLEDSREDVRNYLRDHLHDIRQRHHLFMESEPAQWPSKQDLDELVRHSDGLMIYAATVVRYLDDGVGSPQVKLRGVLARHVGVDPLYAEVISEGEKHPNFKRVLGTLMYLRYPLPLAELAELLQLDVSDVRTALARCHSILTITDNSNESIRPHHASLRDFLTDKERSKDLFCAPAHFHALIAVDCLRTITDIVGSQREPSEYPWIAWYYHCSCLLSHANSEKHLHLYEKVKDQVAAINLDWLKHWMVEALVNAGKPYIISGLKLGKVSVLI